LSVDEDAHGTLPPSYPVTENVEPPVRRELDGDARFSSLSDGGVSYISLKELGSGDVDVNSLTAGVVGFSVAENFCSTVGVITGDLVIDGGDADCGRSANIIDVGGEGEISRRVGLTRS